MLRPTYTSIFNHYVLRTTSPAVHDCPGYVFENDCAIRLSEALVLSDKNFLTVFKNSQRNLCPHGYVRGAQDLGFAYSHQFGPPSIGWETQSSRTDIPKKALSHKGLICFMKIPGYGGQGHIDLWDGSQKENLTRIGGKGYWDSETIWFWTLP